LKAAGWYRATSRGGPEHRVKSGTDVSNEIERNDISLPHLDAVTFLFELAPSCVTSLLGTVRTAMAGSVAVACAVSAGSPRATLCPLWAVDLAKPLIIPLTFMVGVRGDLNLRPLPHEAFAGLGRLVAKGGDGPRHEGTQGRR
jgi:hypothetical protein